MTKQELRKEIKEKVKVLSEEYMETASRKIMNTLLADDSYKNCKTFFCYVSMAKEPATFELLKHAFADGKEVYVPKCYPGNIMKPIRIHSLDELEPGMLDIPEPKDDSDIYEGDSLDLTIVPCISASADGARLGHGAGYYDRYLQKTKTCKACLCFSELMSLSGDIEMTPQDVWMDMVISETGCFRSTSE